MAVKYLAGNRLWGTDAERLALNTVSAPAQSSWKLIARAKVTGGTLSNNDGMDTGTGNSSASNLVITDNTLYSSPTDNIMILFHGRKPDTDGKDPMLQLGKDTIEFDNCQYMWRIIANNSDNYGAEVQGKTIKGMQMENNNGESGFWILNLTNKASFPKQVTSNSVSSNDTDGTTSSTMGKGTFMGGAWSGGNGSGTQWSNKLNRLTIHRKDIDGSNHKYWGEDSEFVVLGYNNDDDGSSGDVFWDLIGETELTQSGELSCSFTAKRWLMYEFVAQQSSSDNLGMIFNDDANAKYAHRTVQDQNSYNDGSYARGDKNCIYYHVSQDTTRWACNGFIDNPDDHCKLVTGELQAISKAGSDTPNHVFSHGKWAKVNQVNKISITDDSGNKNDFASGSYIRVWGHD